MHYCGFEYFLEITNDHLGSHPRSQISSQPTRGWEPRYDRNSHSLLSLAARLFGRRSDFCATDGQTLFAGGMRTNRFSAPSSTLQSSRFCSTSCPKSMRPATLPATLLWKFSVAALEIQFVLWATIGFQIATFRAELRVHTLLPNDSASREPSDATSSREIDSNT
jgi:hypothetical protein